MGHGKAERCGHGNQGVAPLGFRGAVRWRSAPTPARKKPVILIGPAPDRGLQPRADDGTSMASELQGFLVECG